MKDEYSLMLERILNSPRNLESFAKYKAYIDELLYGRITQYRRVIFCGMGGSGTAAIALFSFFRNNLNVDVKIIQDYEIDPRLFEPKTLFIFSSYSGNTQETLSCFNKFLSIWKGNPSNEIAAVSITSGGILLDVSIKNGIPVIKLPEGYLPREAFPFSLSALIAISQACHLFSEINWEKEIQNTISVIPLIMDEIENKAIALEVFLIDTSPETIKIPFIYATGKTSGIAIRWQQQLNENSKHFAHVNVIPEMHHNEIVAWERPYPFILPVLITCADDYPEHIKRMNITAELFIKNEIPHVLIRITEEGLAGLWHGILIGDILSIRLSKKKNVQPSPTKNIDIIKKRLKSFN